MKKFVLIHCGFEKPTEDIMKKWMAWFSSIAEQTVENIGFAGGRNVTAKGTEDLPWGPDAMTGCTIITADDMDAAEKIAKACPFIAGIRVYEVREHKGG